MTNLSIQKMRNEGVLIVKSLKESLKAYRHIIEILLTLFVIALALFAITFSNVSTETYEVERFSIATETIRSPITIEDQQATERQQREAVQSVEDRYVTLGDITTEQLAMVEEFFNAIEVVNQPVLVEETEEEPTSTGDETAPETEDEEVYRSLSMTEKLQQMNELISSDLSTILSEEELTRLIDMDAGERSSSYTLLTTTLNELFNEGITREDLVEQKQELASRFQYASLPNDIRDALETLGRSILVENSFFSIERTMDAERQALNNVEPQMIRAGEVIVREGQTITNDIYSKLELVGLLNSDRNVYPIVGLGLFVILLTGLLGYSYFTYMRKTRRQLKQWIAILIIVLLSLVVMKFSSFFYTDNNHIYLLMPIAGSAMLLKLLFRERIAIIHAIFFAIVATIIFNGEIPGALNLEAGIYLLLSQLSGLVLLKQIEGKVTLIRAMVLTLTVNVLVVTSFILMAYESYQWINLLQYSGYGVAAAVIAGIVTIGTLPFFESILGILSDAKLLTLANPNHPLLKKILTEAPGTYHHSVMVANLSEAACEAIGANGLFARVASYFHDIGKTDHPHYFIENQMGIQNPHDFLAPEQSATIILSHPLDGSRILKEHHLPKEIIDIAEQHHGTSLVKYFYYKAKETKDDVRPDQFRYPGPKPKTKESAVISICDSVEAAVRSMDDPSKKRIDALIDNIIQDRLQDHQLDDSMLTFKELSKVRDTISETLNGIYHSRIKYPTGKEEDKDVN